MNKLCIRLYHYQCYFILFFLSIDYVVSLRKRQQSIETGNIYASLKDIVESCLVSIAFVGHTTEYFILHLCNHSLEGNIVLCNN